MLRDVDGVSGHKFEGSLKKVGPDHHNSLSTIKDPSQSNLLRVCRLGLCSQDKISLLYVSQFTDLVYPMLNVLLPRPVVLDPTECGE